MSVIGSVRSSGTVDCNSFNEVGVTDGLIAYYDAADSGSYKGDGVAWKNLITGFPDLGIPNTAPSRIYQSGSWGFQLNAAGKWFYQSWGNTVSYSATDFTQEAVVLLESYDITADDRGTIMEFIGSNGIFTSYLKGASPTLQGYWYNHPTDGYWESSNTLTRQRWNHVVNVWDYNKGGVTQWVNGVRKFQSPTSGYAINTSSYLYVGAEGGAGLRQFSGYLGIIKMYARALSDAEVMINYGIYKDQFNLP